MSEQLSFDRKKGFVALPVEVMDFDLSPGAFRTLAELCRMANTEGYCWPSLHQLSDRLGRSRSAISGYIKELRAADLVDTQEQKTANGYNYRLKYRVTFWQEWRASLKGQTPQIAERSVQPNVRSIDSKNHNHINHSSGNSSSSLKDALKDWAVCFTGAPYPLARKAPALALIMESRRLLSSATAPVLAPPEQIKAALHALWHRLRVEFDDTVLQKQADALCSFCFSMAELEETVALIAKDWPPHWRKAPQPDGLVKRVKATGITSHHNQVSVLSSYYKRWQLAEKTLQNRAASCSLAS